MFRELVEYGQTLEAAGKLPPTGFYSYGAPIKWIAYVGPDQAYLAGTELDVPRPYSGRTSGKEAHLLADEAAYALGVSLAEKGERDERATEKHALFVALLEKMLGSGIVRDGALRKAGEWVLEALRSGRLARDERLAQVLAKDWVAFRPLEGALADLNLFEHPDAQAFWVQEMQERAAPDEHVNGECAVCGEHLPLAGKIPLGVKLRSKPTPLHSYNKAAFVSHVGGARPEETANIGVCYRCGDTASRAFNHLSDGTTHRKNLILDDARDSLRNQIALFWVKVPAPLEAGEVVLDETALLENLGLAQAELRDETGKPRAEPSQLLNLLNVPWKPRDASFTLDDYGFFLGVLSPNVGRVAVREWFDVSLTEALEHLRAFLEGTRMVNARGEVKPVSVATIIYAGGSKSPNLTRGLLRTAYRGFPPPTGLLEMAVSKLRSPVPWQEPRERWRLGPLLGACKLALYHRKEEATRMSELDPLNSSRAYLCGQLLAVLERAQKRHYYRRYKRNLKTTLVNTSYGAASVAPQAVMNSLVRRATTAHLGEAYDLRVLVEDIVARLVALGGFPGTLPAREQAEFHLGFHHQRQQMRAARKDEDETDTDETGNDQEGAVEE